MRGPRLRRERGFGRKSRPWVARFGRGLLSHHDVHMRGFEGCVEDHGERQCLERVAAPPWARNLKSYENVTSISSVGMVTEQKRPKVLITFALSAAERAMCPGMWAAPLAPRSARELLLFAHPRAGTPDDVLRPRFRCHMRELGASTTFCAARLALFS